VLNLTSVALIAVVSSGCGNTPAPTQPLNPGTTQGNYTVTATVIGAAVTVSTMISLTIN
jgi:hypothetical protein